jgi:Phosphoribosyl transferase/TRSP domain C terminus to PRTase_2
MNQIEVKLASGLLKLKINEADMPLNELCAFAVRKNPKRGFLFVSKVLGKHWPVRPSVAYQAYDALASKMGDINGPVWSVGMSETATGFAQGVMQAWVNQFNKSATFQITTRYPIPFTDALQFEEAHSHAASQYIHAPSTSDAKTLVLMDDEITTGNTLKNLTNQLIRVGQDIQEVVWVALKSWASAQTLADLNAWAESLGVKLKIVALLHGEYQFEQDASFNVALPENSEVNVARQMTLGLDDLRIGIQLQVETHTDVLATDKKQCFLVLGVGESNYAAMKAAKSLEEQGHSVFVQSVTRSPIMVSDAIEHTLFLEDPYKQGVPHYLHNSNKTKFDQVVVFSEVDGFIIPGLMERK